MLTVYSEGGQKQNHQQKATRPSESTDYTAIDDQTTIVLNSPNRTTSNTDAYLVVSAHEMKSTVRIIYNGQIRHKPIPNDKKVMSMFRQNKTLRMLRNKHHLHFHARQFLAQSQYRSYKPIRQFILRIHLSRSPHSSSQKDTLEF